MSLSFDSPESTVQAYEQGFMGCICDPDDLAKLMGELKHPLFGASAYNLFETGKGKLSLPYKCVVKFDPTFGKHERQTTGDCTSHGTRNAVDVTRSVEIFNGEEETFMLRGATEGIYGVRGHRGQGMSVSRSARFVSQDGGILLRKDYGFVDLSTYNSNIGAKWGSRGTPQQVKDEAKKHQVKTVSLVRSVEEARDAIANGYALSVGSNQGFSGKRDKNGIAAPKGSWGHCMAWIGCDDTRELFDETLFLIQNSWGIWNGGPKRHDQPDGSFWVRESVARRMLSQGQAFAFSNVDGFEPRKIEWTIDQVF